MATAAVAAKRPEVKDFNFTWVGQDRAGNLIWIDVPIRDAMQWMGAAIAAIGVSHLIVYAVVRYKQQPR